MLRSGQSLIDQIEHAYSTLDSTSYIDDVILSYVKSLDNLDEETYNIYMELYLSNRDSVDVAKERSKVDCMFLANSHRSRIAREQSIKQFVMYAKSRTNILTLRICSVQNTIEPLFPIDLHCCDKP